MTLIPTAEVARLLGVKPETVYAYVSRGLLTPAERRGGQGSWFDRAAIEALRATRAPTRRGASIRVDSAITFIDGAQPYYRGLPVVELAVECRFEQVAGLLWSGVLGSPDEMWEADDDWTATGRRVVAAAQPLAQSEALRVAVSALGRHDIDVAAAGRFHTSLSGSLSSSRPGGETTADRVARLVGGDQPTQQVVAAVNTALILLADHGLAASTTAARMAASYRADLPAVAGAGLAVLSGAWHGAASTGVERLLAESLEGRSVEHAVAAAVEREERVPGLGQPLYPDGDPRYPALREAIERMRPGAPVLEHLDRLEAIAEDLSQPPPNVDVGLAALSIAAGLRPRSGELIFAFGRMAGWIAHAIEARKERPVRFRATYVGEKPTVLA